LPLQFAFVFLPPPHLPFLCKDWGSGSDSTRDEPDVTRVWRACGAGRWIFIQDCFLPRYISAPTPPLAPSQLPLRPQMLCHLSETLINTMEPQAINFLSQLFCYSLGNGQEKIRWLSIKPNKASCLGRLLKASNGSSYSEIMVKLWFEIRKTAQPFFCHSTAPGFISCFIFAIFHYKSDIHTCQFHSRGAIPVGHWYGTCQ